MAVFRAHVFEPSSVVSEKISEPSDIRTECEPQESQVAMSKFRILRPALISRSLIQNVRHNQRARIIVSGVALARVWQGKDGVLQYPGIIGHVQQVRGIQHWKLLICVARACFIVLRGPRLQTTFETCPLESPHVRPRRFRPCCLP